MINVILFASLREELGTESVCLESSGVRSVRDVIEKLATHEGAGWQGLLSGENILIAVNQEMTDREAGVADGDEVAFFPPVTGG